MWWSNFVFFSQNYMFGRMHATFHSRQNSRVLSCLFILSFTVPCTINNGSILTAALYCQSLPNIIDLAIHHQDCLES